MALFAFSCCFAFETMCMKLKSGSGSRHIKSSQKRLKGVFKYVFVLNLYVCVRVYSGQAGC